MGLGRLKRTPAMSCTTASMRPSCPHTPYVSTACRDTANGQPRQPLRTVVQLSPAPTRSCVLPCLAVLHLLPSVAADLGPAAAASKILSLARVAVVWRLGGAESSLYFSRLASDARCPVPLGDACGDAALRSLTFFLLIQNELSGASSTYST